MNTLLLLDGDAPSLPVGMGIAHWTRMSVPEGHVSVPALVEEHFERIRRDYITWAHDMGLTPVGKGTLREHLAVGDSFSHWWMTPLAEKHPKICRHLYEVAKLRALELHIEASDYQRIEVRTDDGPLVACLRDFCRITGRVFAHRPVEGAHRRIDLSVRGLYERMPAPLKAVVRLGAWLLREKRHLPAFTGDLPAHDRPGTVVTYFPNVDVKAAREGRLRSRYWESLHDALTEPHPPTPSHDAGAGSTGTTAASPDEGPHGVTWLFIFEPTPHFSLPEAIALRDTLRRRGEDGIAFHFIEEFLPLTAIARGVADYCRIALRGLGVEGLVASRCRLPGSAMPFWPYMARNWADATRGWLGLQRHLMRVSFRRMAAQQPTRQEWTIFPMENHPWEKALTHAMHERGLGPVYGTQHSTVRATDLRYYEDPRAFREDDAATTLPDRICCNGSGALGNMREAGMPEDRLAIIEALRYLYLAGQRRLTPAEAAPAPGTPPRLLVMTSFFPDETDNQLDVLADAARKGSLEGYEVVVKPHPNLPVESRLAARFADGAAPAVSNTPVPELLVPGTVVWASNSTTVALEAACKGLPLVVQVAENDFNMCPLLGVPGMTFVKDAEGLAEALAAPRTPDLPDDFLALDAALPRWRALLGLHGAARPQGRRGQGRMSGEDGSDTQAGRNGTSGQGAPAKPEAQDGHSGHDRRNGAGHKPGGPSSTGPAASTTGRRS